MIYGYGLNKTNEFQVSLNEYVNQILSSYLKGDVYMIGHSYGGWMIMKSALRRLASGRSKFKLKGLFTIDPISWKECDISAVTRSYFGFGYANAATPACTRPPADLKNSFGALARHSMIWHNFYQVTFPILHSGMIYQATKNTMPQLPVDRQIVGHHATIMNSEKVWQHINSDVASLLL